MNGLVMEGSTPELFRQSVRQALDNVLNKPPEHRLVFLKSWNEWAEGNHMEPDLRFGHAYLDALRNEIITSDTVPRKEEAVVVHAGGGRRCKADK